MPSLLPLLLADVVLSPLQLKPARAPEAPPAAVQAVQAAASPEAMQGARAVTHFTLDLYQAVKDQPGNLFLSPASVALALALADSGAQNQTARQLDRALYLSDLGHDAGLSALGALQKRLQAVPESEAKLGVANRLWGSGKATYLPAYLKGVEERFGAGLQPVDFGKPAEARALINGWVKDQTHGKIPALLEAHDVTPATNMVLTNAIYFLGRWTTPFVDRRTMPMPFHAASGDKPVPTMGLEHRLLVASEGGVKVLELPYGQGALAMDILLPDDPKGLPALEAQLTEERLTTWLGHLTAQQTDVQLPKFALESRLELTAPLKKLGVQDAFTAPDFGAMGQVGFAISSVVHQATVTVDEHGTEAAAATGVMSSRMARRTRPFEFHADHPFIFLIRDTVTGAPLFIGRVSEPGAR
jgi:serpin B